MWHVALICLGLAGQMPATAPPALAESSEPQFDCGPHTLFLLLRTLGFDVGVEELERILPPRHPEGYSMAELQAAARAFGLRLRGVRFDREDVPLDRPAIARLDQGTAGHFVLLRPVGRTGTMVQILEPQFAPSITDYGPLISGPAWTGQLLVPTSRMERLAPYLIASALLAGAFALARPACRRAVDFRRRRWPGIEIGTPR